MGIINGKNTSGTNGTEKAFCSVALYWDAAQDPEFMESKYKANVNNEKLNLRYPALTK